MFKFNTSASNYFSNVFAKWQMHKLTMQVNDTYLQKTLPHICFLVLQYQLIKKEVDFNLSFNYYVLLDF